MDEDVGTDDKVRNIYIDEFFKVGMAVIKLSSLCINNGVRDWVPLIYFLFHHSSQLIGKIGLLAQFFSRLSTLLLEV